MKTSVLFVCLGNICRSPTAHGVFEAILSQEGAKSIRSQVDVDSAGTGAWHVGEAPDRRAQAAARERGYALEHLRARQVEPTDFQRFDYIMAMDHQNLSDLNAMAPKDFSGELKLFLDYCDMDVSEVPDPYYGGDEGFSHVLDLVESASRGLLSELESRYT